MRVRSISTATVLAVASVPFFPSSAISADTTIGEAVTPVGASCGKYTFVMTGTSGTSSYTVPTNGVITSWRTTVAADSPAVTRSFKLARPDTSNGTYTFAAPTAPLTIPATSTVKTVSQNIRVPAKAGDLLGIYSDANSDACGVATSSTADTFEVYPGNPEGTVSQGTPSFGYRFSIAATLEPDADGDGYGDTTQDQCSTDVTTQGACPVVTPPVTTPAKDTTAPQTTVVSTKAAKAKTIKPGQKKKVKKAKVTVAFAATETSTYTCSVDGGAYTACANPFTLKLKKGTHTIAVRATDAAGNVDTTPATTTLEVKKAKSKT